jgi:hypothetical protein
MTQWLKQSTAATVKMGPFLDATDGDTEMTGLTISQADIRVSKNGGAFAQTNNATGATHDENGFYGVPLDTTDTGTLGRLKVFIHEATALSVWQDFMVVPANVWDSFFGADALQVHAVEISNGLITAAAIATNAIDDDALSADAVTAIQSGLATAAAVTTVDTVVDAIKLSTDNLPSDPADQSLIIAATNSIAALIGTPVVDLATDIGGVPAAILASNFEQDGENGATVAEGLRVTTAALAGKLSGAGTGTETVRSFLDAKNRLVYTVDSSGNRTAVTPDLT